LVVLTALLGGVVALAALMPLMFARLRGRSFEDSHGAAALAMPVPYGVAIAGAALIVTISPHFA
jgi:hypothetical protein